MCLKVFVSGASKEKHIVADYIRQLQEEQAHITLDWTVVMSSVSTPDHELTEDERSHYSGLDLQAIKDADVVWLIIPPVDAPTIGAWIEYGYALGIGRRVVVSGNVSRSIFTSQAHLQCLTHDEAYASIVDLAHRRVPRRDLGVAVRETRTGFSSARAIESPIDPASND